MSPINRDTTGGKAYLELQAKARRDGRPTDELLTTYVLERFLWRISHSKHKNRLILKGGMLLAALGVRRPTADVDLLALQIDNDVAIATALVQEVLDVVSDDGVEFDLAGVRANTIRDDALYSGVRIVIPARLDRARCPLRIDLNVGDPVTPAPAIVMYPAVIGEPFSLLGYPIETVLAEKLVTMLDRGELTTRERDSADLCLLIGRHKLSSISLVAAIKATATHRSSGYRSLRAAVGDLGSKRQNDWTRLLQRAGLDKALPEDYQVAIDEILKFAEDLMLGAVQNEVMWDPIERVWK